jgi:phage shock protein C
VRPRPRRLHRIREGQKLFGVCTGLAAYAEIDVDWVRTLFIFATIVTAGLFLLVYVALAFILPVAATAKDV